MLTMLLTKKCQIELKGCLELQQQKMTFHEVFILIQINIKLTCTSVTFASRDRVGYFMCKVYLTSLDMLFAPIPYNIK